jgi:hypothetical protein
MFEEKRPTCVTVIGWAWIVIGVLMGLSAFMALFVSMMMMGPNGIGASSDQNVPTLMRLFPLLGIVQMAISVLAILSGVHFLRLKAWSRSVLEILTWLLLLFIVGFTIFWIRDWLSMTSIHAPPGFSSMGVVMGIVVLGIYGVPLGIMLRFLRGDKVKLALTPPTP